MEAKNTKRFSLIVFSTVTIVSIALAIWCFCLAKGLTSGLRLGGLALSPIMTALIAYYLHQCHGKYTPKKEILFTALLATFMLGFCGAAAVYIAGYSAHTLDIPLYVYTGIAAFSLAISAWKLSINEFVKQNTKRLIISVRVLTISTVLSWIHSWANTLWSIPEFVHPTLLIIFGLSTIFFGIFLADIIASNKKSKA